MPRRRDSVKHRSFSCFFIRGYFFGSYARTYHVIVVFIVFFSSTFGSRFLLLLLLLSYYFWIFYILIFFFLFHHFFFFLFHHFLFFLLDFLFVLLLILFFILIFFIFLLLLSDTVRSIFWFWNIVGKIQWRGRRRHSQADPGYSGVQKLSATIGVVKSVRYFSWCSSTPQRHRYIVRSPLRVLRSLP